jgi:hypothetical protein
MLARAGGVLFFLGLLMSLISPFAPSATITSLLILTGIAVGFLTVTEKETVKLFLAVLVLALIPGLLSNLTMLPNFIRQIMQAIFVFAGSVAVIPAIVVFYKLAKKK